MRDATPVGLRMLNGEDSRMKLLARLAIGVATMVGSAALTVPSALAGPPTPHCGSNIVCWYGHRDFQGDTSSSNPQTPRECVDLSRFGPVAESVANASDFPQHFWSNKNCTGFSVLVNPGQEIASISFVGLSLGA